MANNNNKKNFSLELIKNLKKQLIEEFESQEKILESEKQELNKREEEWINNSNKLAKIQLKERIKLDVGGTIFATSLQTLKSQPNR
jgi:hypothetical protein